MNQQKTELETKESAFILNPTDVVISTDIKQNEPVFDFIDTVYLTESGLIEAPANSKKDNEKIELIKTAIKESTSIIIHSREKAYLIVNPQFDSTKNELCGRLENYPNQNYQPELHIYLKPVESNKFKSGCFLVDEMGSVVIKSGGGEMGNRRLKKVTLINDAIKKQTVIYLSHGSSLYLVHEPRFDSARNTICGRFEKTSVAPIVPNVTLFLKPKGAQSIQDGCISIEHVGGVNGVAVQESFDAKKSKKKSRLLIATIVLGCLALFSGLFTFILANEITNSVLKFVFLLFFIPGFIILCVAFLICLISFSVT